MNQLGRILDVAAMFKRRDLIEKLELHKKQHIEEFAKATSAYEEQRTELADQLMNAANCYNWDKITEIYTKLVRLSKPVDATKGYQQYIDILSAASDEEIKLSLEDANAILNDSWDWAIAAKATNSLYTSYA